MQIIALAVLSLMACWAPQRALADESATLFYKVVFSRYATPGSVANSKLRAAGCDAEGAKRCGEGESECYKKCGKE